MSVSLLKNLGLSGLFVVMSLPVLAEVKPAACPEWLNGSVGKLHSSESISLCDALHNKPALIVNTASHCGFTKQFGGLEKLHQRYKDQGLVVMGFPSDDFNQEAGDEAEIADVCYKNFGVTFLMSDPVSVRGDKALPLFRYLAEQSATPKWNFYKYLINRKGEVVESFSSFTDPESDSVQEAIEVVLK